MLELNILREVIDESKYQGLVSFEGVKVVLERRALHEAHLDDRFFDCLLFALGLFGGVDTKRSAEETNES
jgi:hypothetical protein